MKLYKKKIETYKILIKKQYVRDAAVRDLAAQCRNVMAGWEGGRTSYFEFLYEQSRFIKKRWWALQAGVLFFVWLLLQSSEGLARMERILGISAAVFAVLVIPEVWKNKRCQSMEIEGACFYSLRQVCAAKILLFAAADLLMITVFFALTSQTARIGVYDLAVNFLIPFNVSGCISFRLLCSVKAEMEYVAVLGSGMWTVVWLEVVSKEQLYKMIAGSVWIAFLLLSFGYLAFCIQKSQAWCENMWEENIDGINA